MKVLIYLDLVLLVPMSKSSGLDSPHKPKTFQRLRFESQDNLKLVNTSKRKGRWNLRSGAFSGLFPDMALFPYPGRINETKAG